MIRTGPHHPAAAAGLALEREAQSIVHAANINYAQAQWTQSPRIVPPTTGFALEREGAGRAGPARAGGVLADLDRRAVAGHAADRDRHFADTPLSVPIDTPTKRRERGGVQQNDGVGGCRQETAVRVAAVEVSELDVEERELAAALAGCLAQVEAAAP